MKFSIFNFQSSKKGVSLYLALIIMFILIAIGLGVSLIIVSQMKMIKGMGDSVVAFYAADTGIEHSLYDKNYGSGTGVVSGSVGGADYDVTSPVANTYRSKGSFANVKRAIEIYAPAVPPPTTVVEPRYMRSDNVLGTSESGALTELFIDTASKIYIGIKVYVLKADSSEIMVYGTNDSADAVQSLSAGSALTTTVSASFTVQNDVFLASTDSIKVVVLANPSSPPSEPLATFTTEQLGAFKLNAATWNVYYRLRRTAKVGSFSQFYFRFGIAGDDSYIDNFTWSH